MKFPVFDIDSDNQFNDMAMEIYRYQLEQNQVYKKYCSYLKKTQATRVNGIPFLPISFFKSHQITTIPDVEPEIIFTSSGTTGSTTSKHLVSNLEIYNQSLDHSFKKFYGNPQDYVILALLPHYLERTGSSLVYMVDRWIQQSDDERSGFYLNNLTDLAAILEDLQQSDRKVILIGVTFALLQLAEQFPMDLNNTIIIETGGMKGMRKEMIKSELHSILKSAFAKAQIHSEYGMTELLSQAYAPDGIHFKLPPWMRVNARETNDPLSKLGHGKTGGLNVIDLANYESCPFIATQDLCKTHADGTFEVLGRFDNSDIRGCNLMAIN
ncbi:Acyl-protein synthetase, LuxE [Nonlabens sp. Hel1_33_55]|uniref:LuxE/PaaK family acyltransferase n=1 Tax=Nonlabens sp. Hel1_33_55 TaxID=1336802 RepID=UPI000875BA1E|nr:acyl transferase [Nonlabens sp. Hel1_33_55]SCY39951.1 Acyl-protein synthetase, LuxE [Nonlabens sp. Hel1_33_55]